MTLSALIEALLFVHGEQITVARLSALLNKKEKEINDALQELEHVLRERGIRLIQKDNAVLLSTAPEASEVVQNIIKEELHGTLTKATLETLAIIVYHGPISRPNIDYIRGVNSSFTLRTMMIRELIERSVNPKDKRMFLYTPSVALLRFLGITKLESLPEYAEFRNTMDTFLKEGALE